MCDVQELMSTIREQGYAEWDPARLEELLGRVEKVFEEDTCMCGMIRILRVEEGFLSQETTDQGKVVLRFFPVLEEAQALVRSHLNTYANMWDGCGCKVRDYPEKNRAVDGNGILVDASQKMSPKPKPG